MEIAVIKTGGKQYIVSPGQKIKIEKLDISERKECFFNEVLLYKNDNDDIKIGKPFIENLKIVGRVVKQEKNKKVVVFKYKPKKRYKIRRGHRQPYTEVEIVSFNVF